MMKVKTDDAHGRMAGVVTLPGLVVLFRASGNLTALGRAAQLTPEHRATSSSFLFFCLSLVTWGRAVAGRALGGGVNTSKGAGALQGAGWDVARTGCPVGLFGRFSAFCFDTGTCRTWAADAHVMVVLGRVW
jgi:hypothetical protein